MPEDEDQGFSSFNIPAEYLKFSTSDEAEMLVDMGEKYFVGDEVAQDYNQAVDYFEQAAAMGSVQAMVELGYCYYHGHSVPIDYEKAFSYFTKAALLSAHPAALYKLGDLYANGYYVDEDDLAAFRLYATALQFIIAGGVAPLYPNICWRMGGCLQHGVGVDEDLYRALDFYHEAEKHYLKNFEHEIYFSEEGLRRTRRGILEVEQDIVRQKAERDRQDAKDEETLERMFEDLREEGSCDGDASAPDDKPDQL